MRAAVVFFLPALLLGLVIGVQWQTQSTRSPIASRYSADLAESATEMQHEQDRLKSQVADLRTQLDAIQRQTATLGSSSASLAKRIESLRDSSGLTAKSGSGVVVTLDDGRLSPSAPRRSIELAIVHSQDIADVFNAAWKAGALGIAVNGERITSATACVGSTIQVNGRLMSPPFVVSVLGQPDQLVRALSDAATLRDLKRRSELYGLRLSVDRAATVRLPAYTGTIPVHAATPLD
ncbi:MAG: DUF881 domain-containing protein [Chloroflexota bacterium]|nr:DUF881 domain-containing protein [Chloroflexota bacterium]MDE3194605.1 DUF881 domain-containing protein [Chloroflexota bacterium]